MTRTEKRMASARRIGPGFFRLHGGRSLAGKVYLPSETSPTTAIPGATPGEAVDSKLPAPAAPAVAGHLPTKAKLGLRYER